MSTVIAQKTSHYRCAVMVTFDFGCHFVNKLYPIISQIVMCTDL